MELIVSGVKKNYDGALTVTQLLAVEKVATPEYVTVSINEELVDQAAFETHLLADGDQVEFLYFMGGGRG
ncbi:MAG: sulfur carrier protein ThiS [Deltaproteobacteria bacterium]|jgi:sulfur carrier protein|nr:sulfur carrier protein ThiS [Deltaproteobacteria bacterium]